jgi:hypothetical protein
LKLDETGHGINRLKTKEHVILSVARNPFCADDIGIVSMDPSLHSG